MVRDGIYRESFIAHQGALLRVVRIRLSASYTHR